MLLCFGTSKHMEAQTKYAYSKHKTTHLGLHFGVSNYLGDLGGKEGIGKGFIRDNQFKKRTFFYGFSLTRYLFDFLSIRGNFTAGSIAGSDHDVTFKSTADPAYFRYKRNLDFRSNITEGALLVQIIPLKMLSNHSSFFRSPIQPYLGIGLGVFSFNPQGSFFDPIAEDYVWVDLKPLRTEGQGMKEYPGRKVYSLTQFNIPMVLGTNYQLTPRTTFSLEIIGRTLFTDYLDDVSTNYIDPELFSKYMSEENASVARSVANKSNLIDPDFPFKMGDQRGRNTKNDYYFSVQVGFTFQINRSRYKYRYQPPARDYDYYRYDDRELCL